MTVKNYFLCLFFFLLVCCISKRKTNEEEVVATISNDTIFLSEIDKLSQQELFDELNRIFYIRKTTLNYYLRNKVLDLESKKHNQNLIRFLDSIYQKNINDSNLKKFLIKNLLKDGIPNLERRLSYVNPNSKKGKELLLFEFKKYLKNKLIDSLLTKYSVQTFLSPPIAPTIDLANDLYIHYRGNLDSKVTFIEISDFECGTCRSNYPISDSIYQQYKHKIKFGFCNFSPYATLCAISAESAGFQDKFWEFHDSVFKMTQLPDTVQVFRIAKSLRLDMKLFRDNFYDKSLVEKINSNSEELKQMGFYATPTFVINGKFIFNSTSKAEIEKAIEKALKEN
jgi:protein-disulfide isomerase